jgi:hypothetical protein
VRNPPKKMFVTVENPGTDDEYFSTQIKLDKIHIEPGEEKSVWVYELVEKKKVKCIVQETGR